MQQYYTSEVQQVVPQLLEKATRLFTTLYQIPQLSYYPSRLIFQNYQVILQDISN